MTVALAAVSALSLVSADAAASPASIAITNASFEDPVLADEAISGSDGPITGWLLSVTGTVSLDDLDWGAWNPPAAAFDTALPDGDNVALVFYASEIGIGEIALSQTTAGLLDHAIRYDLTAQVGDLSPLFSVFYDGFPGARAELRAGGELLASGGPDIVIEGNFSPIQVTYVAPSSLGQIGEALEVRLIDTNELAGGGVTWDLVSLRTTAVEAYDFSMGDANGSVSGIFSYTPGAASQAGIPTDATVLITHASGDLAGFASVDWTSGSIAAYEQTGEYRLGITSLSEAAIDFGFGAAPFDLSGPLPLGSFSESGSVAALLDAQVFAGSDPGANVTLTAAPEPNAVAITAAAIAVLARRARRRGAA